MYTLPSFQVAYESLYQEWIFMIYGEQQKGWYRNLMDSIEQSYFYILDLIHSKMNYFFNLKKNYPFFITVIFTGLAVFFTAYKVMKILLSLELKKSVMEFQWRRNENSDKMSSTFHENNNESLTEDFTLGTSLTAIVKPTIRTNETWETIKDDEGNQSEAISNKGVPNNVFSDFDSLDNEDAIIPLVKCTSSLYVVTSKDSLNAELQREVQFNTKNRKSLEKENRKNEKIIHKVNDNVKLVVHESSSCFEVDDVISNVYEDTISHYQYSISAYTSHDTPLHRNSSYASGHFVEKFPDLDLSPIQSISPIEGDFGQSLKIEMTNKETDSKESRRESNHQNYLTKSQRRYNDEKYLSNSLTSSSTNVDKSPELFSTCFSFKTDSSDQTFPNRMISKIPRLNFAVEFEEGAPKSSKLDAYTEELQRSKIPIRLRNFPATKTSTHKKLNRSLGNVDSTQTEQEEGTKKANQLELKKSDHSLDRFLQLEKAAGCYSGTDLIQL